MWEARNREKACEREEGEEALCGNPCSDGGEGLWKLSLQMRRRAWSGLGATEYRVSSTQPLRSPELCLAKGYMQERGESESGGSLCTEGG